VVVAAQAIGLALGPTLGGLLVSTLGWRWVFGINVPIGIIAIVAGIYLLPRTRQRTPTASWDRSGLLLLATATTTGLLGVSAVSGLGLPAWATIGLLGVSAVCVLGFVLREQHASVPLLDPVLLRARTVSAGLAGALCGCLELFGPLVLIPVTLTAGVSPSCTPGLS